MAITRDGRRPMSPRPTGKRRRRGRPATTNRWLRILPAQNLPFEPRLTVEDEADPRREQLGRPAVEAGRAGRPRARTSTSWWTSGASRRRGDGQPRRPRLGQGPTRRRRPPPDRDCHQGGASLRGQRHERLGLGDGYQGGQGHADDPPPLGRTSAIFGRHAERAGRPRRHPLRGRRRRQRRWPRSTSLGPGPRLPIRRLLPRGPALDPRRKAAPMCSTPRATARSPKHRPRDRPGNTPTTSRGTVTVLDLTKDIRGRRDGGRRLATTAGTPHPGRPPAEGL